MADRALSTSRRTLLGAAASLPVLALPAPVRAEPVETKSAAGLPPPFLDAALWNERLAHYRRLAARAKAAAETGWFRAANDRYNRESAEPAADRAAAFARISRAEDLYWHRCTAPMQEAAVALVLTPAPELEAVREKVSVIRTYRLHELEGMSPCCFEVLEEDLNLLL